MSFTSKAKITKSKSEAARANGAKSRGPVTPEGRATSPRNSLRHGLSAESVLVPGEKAEDFESLLASYVERFQPADGVEADLVHTLAIARWRALRLYRIESDMFKIELVDRKKEIDRAFAEIDDPERLAWVFREMANKQRSLDMLLRYEGALTRSYDRAFKQLLALQSTRIHATAAPAPARTGAQQNEPKPVPQSFVNPDAAEPSPVPRDPNTPVDPDPPGLRPGGADLLSA